MYYVLVLIIFFSHDDRDVRLVLELYVPFVCSNNVFSFCWSGLESDLSLFSKASATISSQSLEVTSKAVPVDEENNNVRSLTEKLSAALMNISAKEELVKQHAKVAEEAVSGIVIVKNYYCSEKNNIKISTILNILF